MSRVATHWMRPMKYGNPKGRHVLVYIREEYADGVSTPAERRVWCADVKDGGWNMRLVDSYHTTDRLDSLLDRCCAPKGETTLWLLRGWTDLVLSGLAELMDAGVVTWRYCNITGHKLLVRGEWRGRKIVITSLSNWTGGRWDNWGLVGQDAGVKRLMTSVLADYDTARLLADEGEVHAIETLATIVHSSVVLGVNRVAPTSAAAGLLVWRTWLGPTVTIEPTKGKRKKGNNKPASEVYIAPLPNRPAKARTAERHVVYALTSRQLRRGAVEGPIYCVDIRSAYLLGMMTTPLPIIYQSTLNKPTTEEATQALLGHTGLALVRVQADDSYYPCRLGGSVVPCKGRFWTWLCGSELARAYCDSHIAETWCLHTWIASTMARDTQINCALISNHLDRNDHCAVKKAWRAVYSSLVGRFAGWRKVWSDSPAAAGFGRWATWLQADPRSGNVVPYRSVAGKVQMLRAKEDADTSVPLLFGCVTAQVRWLVHTLIGMSGIDNVANIVADSLWVTQEGWQGIQRGISQYGLPVDNIKVKAIYDRAWMTGRAVSVVERDGKRQLILPGVLDGAAINSTGHVVMEHADDWSNIGEPRATDGVRKREVRYHVPTIVERYGKEAEVLLPGETVDIPLLGESLLQPLHGDRSIDDV